MKVTGCDIECLLIVESLTAALKINYVRTCGILSIINLVAKVCKTMFKFSKFLFVVPPL